MDSKWLNKIKLGLLAIILFLITNKTWSFVALSLNVPVYIISGLTLVLILSLLKSKILYKSSINLFALLIIAPILLNLLHADLDVNYIILSILLYLIYILGKNVANLVSEKSLNNILKYCLIFNIFFGFLSFINPFYFEKYSELTSSLTFYSARAYGFYMQPNAFAMGVLFNYILYDFTSKKTSKLLTIFTLLILLLAASRLALVLFAFYILYFLLKTKFLNILKIIFLSLIVLTITLNYVNENPEFKDILQRIESLSDVANQINEDGSLNDRLTYQKKYIEKISEKPFLGHGIGSNIRMKEENKIYDVAHQAHLEYLLEGGIFYYLFFLSFLTLNIKFIINKKLPSKIKYICFMIVFYSFFSSTLMTERIIFISLGIVQLYYENFNFYSRNEWRRG